MADLIERLEHAAASALRDLRPDLVRDPSSIRSVVLEIDLAWGTADGAPVIREGRAFVERAVRVNRVLGLGGGRQMPPGNPR
jgi:hypothetical protein